VSRLDELQDRLVPLKAALLDHAVYRHVGDLRALRVFMEHHVFAVWDFMSLLKTLQRRLCCVEVPWLPPRHPLACRLVNEVVLGEESDEDGKGGFASHFDLYRRAMSRCGANTTAIDRFLHRLGQGKAVQDALPASDAAEAARRFVLRTFTLLEQGELCEVAAAFALGREDLLPDLFRRVVDALDTEAGGGLQDFRYYLERHIGLDETEHGPAAGRLVEMLCGTDECRWRAAERAAVGCLEARLELWDGILAAVQAKGKGGGPAAPAGSTPTAWPI
jgi:hypothetical protein